MNKHLLTLMFTFLVVLEGQSQNGFPTSSAERTLRNMEVPVGHYTGRANISLNLYTLNVDGYSFPMTLSYNGTGVRVDEEITEVGTGWSLNLGEGSIVEEVKSSNIDACGTTEPLLIPNRDYRHQHLRYKFGSLGVLGKYSQVKESFTSVASHMIEELASYEPNIFSYSAMGRSGKFYFDSKTCEFHELGEVGVDPVVIEGNKHLRSDSVFNLLRIKFKDGFTFHYRLSGQPPLHSYWYHTRSEIDFGPYYAYRHLNYGNIFLEYHLEKIDLPTGKSVDFQYAFSEISEITTPYERVSIRRKRENVGSSGIRHNRVDYVEVYDLQKQEPKHRIDFFNSGSHPTASGSEDNGFRRKLDSLTIKTYDKYGRYDDSLELPECYKFEYNEGVLPARDSKSMDHWGYFNGASNSSLTPRFSKNPFLAKGRHSTSGGTANRGVDPEKMKRGVLTKITYPSGVFKEFEYGVHRFRDTEGEHVYLTRAEIDANSPEFTRYERIGGGLRIEKIITGQANDTKGWYQQEYDYEEEYLSYGKISSGQLMIGLHYFTSKGNPRSQSKARVVGSPVVGYREVREQTSPLLVTIDPSTGEKYGYPLPPSGSRVYVFECRPLSSSTLDRDYARANYAGNSGNVLLHFMRSDLDDVDFQSAHTYLGGTTERIGPRHEWEPGTRFFYEKVGPILLYPAVGTFFYRLDVTADITPISSSNNNILATQSSFIDDPLNGKRRDLIVYDRQGNMVSKTRYDYDIEDVHDFNGLKVERISPEGSNDIELLSTYYPLNCYRVFLDYSKTTSYDVNGIELSSRTSNSYNSEWQLESSFTRRSDGKTFTTDYKYANTPEEDFENPPYGDLAMKAQLASEYSLTTPLEVISYEDGQMLGRSRTMYEKQNSFYPVSQWASIGNTSLEKVSWRVNDEQGAPVMTYAGLDSNEPLVSLYAYEGRFKIADLVFPSLEEAYDVNKELERSIGIHPYSSARPHRNREALKSMIYANDIRPYLQRIRDYFEGQALMTSYLYEPGLGMIEQVDVHGLPTSYEYDYHRRLRVIKNYNGYIVKRYNYHRAGSKDFVDAGPLPAPVEVQIEPPLTASFNAVNPEPGANISFEWAGDLSDYARAPELYWRVEGKTNDEVRTYGGVGFTTYSLSELPVGVYDIRLNVYHNGDLSKPDKSRTVRRRIGLPDYYDLSADFFDVGTSTPIAGSSSTLRCDRGEMNNLDFSPIYHWEGYNITTGNGGINDGYIHDFLGPNKSEMNIEYIEEGIYEISLCLYHPDQAQAQIGDRDYAIDCYTQRIAVGDFDPVPGVTISIEEMCLDGATYYWIPDPGETGEVDSYDPSCGQEDGSPLVSNFYVTARGGCHIYSEKQYVWHSRRKVGDDDFTPWIFHQGGYSDELIGLDLNAIYPIDPDKDDLIEVRVRVYDGCSSSSSSKQIIRARNRN